MYHSKFYRKIAWKYCEFEKSKKISEQISKYIKQQSSVKKELDDILSSIPNIALKDIPVGKDESSNKEISKCGEIPKFKFEPKSHYEVGEKLQMLDFDLATKTTGSRFVFVTGKLAQLERAISNFTKWFEDKQDIFNTNGSKYSLSNSWLVF